MATPWSRRVLDDPRASAVTCAAVGALALAHWSVADVSGEETSQQHDWAFVLFFSALVLGIGVGIVVVAHQVPAAGAGRVAWFVLGASAAASVTNVVEDGLRVEAAFFAFAAETLLLLAGCVVLAAMIVLRARRAARFWALVPLATVVGVAMYVELGGPLLALTWVGAAVACAVSGPAEVSGGHRHRA